MRENGQWATKRALLVFMETRDPKVIEAVRRTWRPLVDSLHVSCTFVLRETWEVLYSNDHVDDGRNHEEDQQQDRRGR